MKISTNSEIPTDLVVGQISHLKKIQFRNVNDFRNALTQDGKEVTEENQVRNYFDHNEKYNFF